MRSQAFLVFASALFLTGCLKLEIVMKLKKDGSGRIVERVLFDAETLGELFKNMPGAGAQKPWEIDEVELKAQATQKGQGVTYVGAKPISKGQKWKGYEATYAFKDVNEVSINPDPGERAPKQPGQTGGKKSRMRFKFKKGSPATLTVHLPKDEGKTKGEKPVDPNDPGFQMAAGMLEGMSVDIGIEVAGKVTKSTASHRSGSKVTLMKLDFSAIAGDRQKLAEVMNAEDFSSAAKAFNKVKGMQIETQRKVQVAFK